MLSYERSGPTGSTPLLLVHAGIADRRMWDPIWPTLTADRDVVRVDLRGYGESAERPDGAWSARADVLEVLDHLGIDRAHLVGCSFGAGVCVELALERPELAASLVLAAPGGALLTEKTDELAAAWELEGAAVEAGDLDAAVEANVIAWVDGPHRGPDVVPAAVRDAVRTMQRRDVRPHHRLARRGLGGRRRARPRGARAARRDRRADAGDLRRARHRQHPDWPRTTCSPASTTSAGWRGTTSPTCRRWSAPTTSRPQVLDWVARARGMT